MNTVKQVAALSGVTPRTLHHYDAIGLLKPSRVGKNGYRWYDHQALLRLQQILLYRELGLGLEAIGRLLDQRTFSVVAALEDHRKALRKRIGRLERLVETVERTISAQKGEIVMNEQQLFEGLSAQEKEYAEEALERWDPSVVRESHRRYAALTADQKAAMKQAGADLNRDWAALIGTDVADPRVRALVERWRQGVAFFWDPSPEALVGLARMYGDDARFRATYDAVDPRLAAYIRQCVEAVYGRR